MNYIESENELRGLIIKDLQLEKQTVLPSGGDLGFLRARLSEIINYLIDNDYGRLLNAMYRLDISENLFREAFDKLKGEEVASRLADLVIEREMEKIKTRMKYKSGS